MRRSGLTAMAAGLTLLGGVAEADPRVVVIAVIERDRGPAPGHLDAAVQSAGEGALAGAALRTRLEAPFGRFAPREDLLAGARAAVASGCELFFADTRALRRRGLSGSGPVESQRALQAAVTSLEAAPEALRLVEENRAAYLRALATLARIELEASRAPEARAWAERARRFDPGWTPSTEEFPPSVTGLFGSGSGPAGAQATVTVRLPREGCSVSVDGRPSPGTGATRTLSLPAGSHRLMATCEGPTRVRVLDLGPGAAVTVPLDPRLDETLRTDPDPALGYAGPADTGNLLVGDAAAVGEALGATRVVAVGREVAVVVDVARGRVVANVPTEGADFGPRLARALGGQAEPPASSLLPEVVSTAPSSPSHTGAWVLGGAGVAALIGAGVFFGLRQGALSDAAELCPEEGGVLRCPGPAQETEAAGLRSDAGTFTVGAAVAGGVGVAALVGAIVWGTRSAEARPTLNVAGSGLTAGIAGRF